MKSWNTWWNLNFIHCSNYLILDWTNSVPLPTKLFIWDSAFIIRTCVILWSSISHRKLLPIIYTTFHQSKMIILFFFYLVIFLSFHAVVGGHATGINSKSIFFLHAFWCFYLLAPSYMSNIVNSLRITIVTIFIIKNSVIKGILLRTVSLLKNIRVYITKDYIIIRKYRMIKFFDYLICNKPIRNKF